MFVLFHTIACFALVPTIIATITSFTFDCANTQPHVPCLASPSHWCYHEDYRLFAQCFLGKPHACGWGELLLSKGTPPSDICLGEGFLSDKEPTIVSCSVDPKNPSMAVVELSLNPTKEERESLSKKIGETFKKATKATGCQTALQFTTNTQKYLTKFLAAVEKACKNNLNDGCPVKLEGSSLVGTNLRAHLYNFKVAKASAEMMTCHLKIVTDEAEAIGTNEEPQLISTNTLIDYAIVFEVQKETGGRIKGTDAFAANIRSLQPVARGNQELTKKMIGLGKKFEVKDMEPVSDDYFKQYMEKLIPLFRAQLQASLDQLVKKYVQLVV